MCVNTYELEFVHITDYYPMLLQQGPGILVVHADNNGLRYKTISTNFLFVALHLQPKKKKK